MGNRGRVHRSAVVDDEAELAEDVEVGPYAVIGRAVRVGAGSRLAAHAVLRGPLVVGARNEFHSFSVVGGEPQDRRCTGGGAGVIIGDGNVFREHVTVHGGTEGRSTHVGSNNLLMVGAHLAHDVRIGSHCTLANGVQIAGHVVIGDYVNFGGLCAVAQHLTVGESAFVAGGSMVERSVAPFVIVQGDRARIRALNVVGLRRRGVPESSILALERAFRKIFHSHAVRADALASIDCVDEYVQRFVASLLVM